jgi:L-lactate dehydrogenase complex protein LldE
MKRPTPSGASEHRHMTSPDIPRTVYFFGTCLANAVRPDAALAAMNILKRLGVEPVYPLAQGCCGQPAYNSGFPDEARRVALARVKDFQRRDWPVVVPSGSCAGMLRSHYPKLFKSRPELFQVLAFSQRVVEFFEFLETLGPNLFTDKGPPVTVTWHSCCHALRETGSTRAAKAILRGLSNVTLVELAREYECCGFGGTFSVKRPELSEAMVRDKVADIAATGASIALSADCGCLTSIEGHARRVNATFSCMHLAEFLWGRIHA